MLKEQKKIAFNCYCVFNTWGTHPLKAHKYVICHTFQVPPSMDRDPIADYEQGYPRLEFLLY